ncbi:zinc finger protein 239-like [Achroia grisella]|uniref:zinc finger protein 239-like n=1 Tax=Achroia grisella TaxID=688607 RepID=UPI0027D1EF36|nr:zinc finger protein 239-like [Achroia grisella]
MDFSKICRICLDSSKQTVDLFTSFSSKRNTFYSDMLSECTTLKPHEKDGLPRQICKECSRQLKRSYAFNKQCEDSEKELKIHILSKKDSAQKFLPNNTDETDGNALKDEEIKIEVKFELTELNSDIANTNKSNVNKDDNNDVKTEPDFNHVNDSCWDADDDTLLQELRQSPDTGEQEQNCEKEVEKPKKKRGRKKKDAESISDARKPHQCDICGKFLSTKSNLKAHKICHTDMRPYKCTECPATFRGHSALFQHKKVHSGDTPYHCEFCSKRFSRRTGLINHVRIHTGEKQYSCDICFKSFIQSAQLSIHMKRHNGDKPFLCQDCGKGFPIKADLMVHQRIHNGEKPYSCNLCTKTFATSGNLSIHKRIHNKEIRYNCKECNRGFVTCSAYSVHLKRHKGQRDYSCECGKSFYTSSALKQHKTVHTGEKKYQCKICERKFSQCSHLSRHFKRDHLKANAPVPSSDHYKVVLDNGSNKFWTVVDNNIQKISENDNVNIEDKLTHAHILNVTEKCNGS